MALIAIMSLFILCGSTALLAVGMSKNDKASITLGLAFMLFSAWSVTYALFGVNGVVAKIVSAVLGGA